MSGFVHVSEMSADGHSRKFALPAAYAAMLTDELSLSYLAPLARMIAAVGMKLSAVVNAHRNGGGVSWDEFGVDMRESQADMNRPSFVNLLVQEWFGSVPELADRLSQGARVADIGCGCGWSAISLAVGYDKINAGDPSVAGDYDLVAAFECILLLPLGGERAIPPSPATRPSMP